MVPVPAMAPWSSMLSRSLRLLSLAVLGMRMRPEPPASRMQFHDGMRPAAAMGDDTGESRSIDDSRLSMPPLPLDLRLASIERCARRWR